jgi:uncharacterized YigZ family protein
MKSIKNEVSNTYIIKKSKFICKLFKVDSLNIVNDILKNIKNEYNDATHVCYGYILDNLEKCSDDKEPSGTAGLPILNTLKANNLDHILCVVIRYFGGIKLGTGGLSRAYATAVKEALNDSIIIELEEGYLIEIEYDYTNTKLIDYMLHGKKIINKQYNHNTIYQFYLNKDELNFIPELEKVVIHLSIKDKTWIKK